MPITYRPTETLTYSLTKQPKNVEDIRLADVTKLNRASFFECKRQTGYGRNNPIIRQSDRRGTSQQRNTSTTRSNMIHSSACMDQHDRGVPWTTSSRKKHEEEETEWKTSWSLKNEKNNGSLK